MTSAHEQGTDIVTAADKGRRRKLETWASATAAKAFSLPRGQGGHRRRQLAFFPSGEPASDVALSPASEGNGGNLPPLFSRQNRPKWPENTHFHAQRARTRGKAGQLAS